jgi:hypothetical protein
LGPAATDFRGGAVFKNSGAVAKLLVGVFGAVSMALGVYYGTERWEPVVVAGLTAVVLWLVPNSPQA